MAFTKTKVFFTSLVILVALLGVSVGVTVHKVGDSQGWTIMGVNYETWASSKTFQVGDSLVFEYDNGFHDLTQVTHDDFELCDVSKPITRYETGLDTITLTKPGVQYFICGTPGHCNIGQKLQVLVMPASLGPVAAPVPVPVRSPTSSSSPAPPSLADSPVNNASQYHMGQSPAPVPVPVRSPSSSSSPALPSLADSPVNNASQYHMGQSQAPVPVPVRSPSSSSSPAPSPANNAPQYHMGPSPVNNAPQYHMGPSPAPVSSASNSVAWTGVSFLPLVFLLLV